MQAVTGVLAINVAFVVVFGLAVLAFLAMAVFTARWAVRRDRQRFGAWRARQQGVQDPGALGGDPNGAQGEVGR